MLFDSAAAAVRSIVFHTILNRYRESLRQSVMVVVVFRNPALEFVEVIVSDLTAWRVRMERL